eukprot:3291895-Rhodomonas_salina.1
MGGGSSKNAKHDGDHTVPPSRGSAPPSRAASAGPGKLKAAAKGSNRDVKSAKRSQSEKIIGSGDKSPPKPHPKVTPANSKRNMVDYSGGSHYPTRLTINVNEAKELKDPTGKRSEKEKGSVYCVISVGATVRVVESIPEQKLANCKFASQNLMCALPSMQFLAYVCAAHSDRFWLCRDFPCLFPSICSGHVKKMCATEQRSTSPFSRVVCSLSNRFPFSRTVAVGTDELFCTVYIHVYAFTAGAPDTYVRARSLHLCLLFSNASRFSCTAPSTLAPTRSMLPQPAIFSAAQQNPRTNAGLVLAQLGECQVQLGEHALLSGKSPVQWHDLTAQDGTPG